MLPGFPELAPEVLREFLEDGDVVNFLLPLDSQTEPPDLSCLSIEERGRFCRFRVPQDAMAFVRARIFLRSFLTEAFAIDPVILELGKHGKPDCMDPRSPFFSISHGAGNCLLSFSGKARIGVDLEDPRRVVKTQKIAKRYFSKAERDLLDKRGPDMFIKLWTRKEARLKAGGEGFSVRAADVCTLTDPEWSYQEVVSSTSLYGMVAVPGVERKLHLFKSS